MSKVILQSNFGAIPAKATRHVSTAVEDVADKTLDAVKESMEQPKSGRQYKGHRASAEGEAPAIESRELYDSLAVEVDGLTAAVTAGTDHAVRLEFDMGRPFLTPATLAMQDDLTREAGEAIEKAVRESKVG